MATLSVSVSDDLRTKMTKLEEVNWSAVARRAFEEKIKQVEFLKDLAMKSKLTERDAKNMSDKISRNISQKFRSLD